MKESYGSGNLDQKRDEMLIQELNMNNNTDQKMKAKELQPPTMTELINCPSSADNQPSWRIVPSQAYDSSPNEFININKHVKQSRQHEDPIRIQDYSPLRRLDIS